MDAIQRGFAFTKSSTPITYKVNALHVFWNISLVTIVLTYCRGARDTCASREVRRRTALGRSLGIWEEGVIRCTA